MKFSEIKTYWNNNPCSGGNISFPFNLFKGKKVLEIGCGSGVDTKRFVEAGAIYTGIDLTPKAILNAKIKVGNKAKLLVMNAEYMDFPDNYFDLVYSFGVIHHTLSPKNIINEAYRVLKDGGKIYIMLYNKLSVRYILDIMFLRKILWHLGYPKYNSIKKTLPHPTHNEWVSMNTDTLGCPMARVYTKQEAVDLLNKFGKVKTFTTNWGWFRILIGTKYED